MKQQTRIKSFYQRTLLTRIFNRQFNKKTNFREVTNVINFHLITVEN